MNEQFYEQLRENEARCPKCGYRDWFTYEGENEDDECFGCMRCGYDVVIKFEPYENEPDGHCQNCGEPTNGVLCKRCQQIEDDLMGRSG